jgi:hypothetical protein
MTFQLGVYSFGNTPLVDGEGLGPTSQAIRNVMETIRLAEQVGLDFFGVGSITATSCRSPRRPP